MSDSHRRDRGALIAFGISLLAVVLIAGITSWSDPKESGGGQQQQETHGASEQPPTPSSGSIVEPDGTPDLEKPCDPGKDNRNSDLCAQWKAADAAERGAYWTQGAFWVGFVGLMLGLGTLGAAVAAARYAKAAADHTEAGVNEANRAASAAEAAVAEATKANTITASAYITEQRPWIEVDLEVTHIAFKDTGLEVRTRVKLSNRGKTPAIHVQARQHFDVLDRPYEGVMRRQVFRLSKIDKGNIDPLAATYRALLPGKTDCDDMLTVWHGKPRQGQWMDGTIDGGTASALTLMFRVAVAYQSMSSDEWLSTYQWFEIFEKTADGFKIIDPRNGDLAESQILVRVADGGTYIK